MTAARMMLRGAMKGASVFQALTKELVKLPKTATACSASYSEAGEET